MKQLGKYEPIELLGSGATADVYQARDTVLGRDVAIKVLKPALVPDTSAFARFMQEAQAAAKLFHNHIATVLDMGEADGRYFIAMRLISGHSLDKILEEEGTLNWNDALLMVKQIGDALDYAHDEGFLHRDVKPSNIIRDDKGNFWLTDFGLTRAMMSTGLTSHTGAVLGTPPYIAPEIWNGEEASPASDQYALACVLYETLTGDVLFKGKTPVAVLTKHTKGPNFPGSWLDGIPNEIESTLANALSSYPERRYKNMGAFASALINHKSKGPPPVLNTTKKSHQKAAAAKRSSKDFQELPDNQFDGFFEKIRSHQRKWSKANKILYSSILIYIALIMLVTNLGFIRGERLLFPGILIFTGIYFMYVGFKETRKHSKSDD